MPFPSPPWTMDARMWLSLFVLRGAPGSGRPAGLYGAAFVSYDGDSPLHYHELLVARLVRDGVAPRVRISDIWVDSPESLAGGRSLWSIPKDLADLPMADASAGPVSRVSWSGVAEGARIADATFTSLPGAALVRTPFATTLSQESLHPGAPQGPVLTSFTGSSKALPCRGSWTFDPTGPLAFLHRRRPVLSFHLRDVRLRFG